MPKQKKSATATPSKKGARAALGSPKSKVKKEDNVQSPTKERDNGEMLSPRDKRAIKREQAKQALETAKKTAVVVPTTAKELFSVEKEDISAEPSFQFGVVTIAGCFPQPPEVTIFDFRAEAETDTVKTDKHEVAAAAPAIKDAADKDPSLTDEYVEDPAEKAGRVFDEFMNEHSDPELKERVRVEDIQKLMDLAEKGFADHVVDEQIQEMRPTSGFVSRESFVQWYAELCSCDEEEEAPYPPEPPRAPTALEDIAVAPLEDE